jgi:hypothetical protein
MIVPQPPYFYVSLIEIKLTGNQFDTTEVIEAESCAVLNTLTEQDFHDPFKNWKKHWERCQEAEGDYFEGNGGSRSKVRF